MDCDNLLIVFKYVDNKKVDFEIKMYLFGGGGGYRKVYFIRLYGLIIIN